MEKRNNQLNFSKRASHKIWYGILIVALAAVSGWGFYQYRLAAQLRQELDNQYSRALYDMTGYVKNVETQLSKALVTSSPTITALMLQEAWRQSNLAQTNLGQLPINQPTLAAASKFLVQVGDLAYALNNQNLNEKGITDEQYETIKQLHGYAKNLGDSLEGLISEINQGRIRWGDIASKGTPMFEKASKELIDQQLENIEKQFQEYPTLIYDGPFSDHLSDVKPKGLEDREYSEEEAKQRAADFLGADRVVEVRSRGASNYENMEAYDFEVVLKDEGFGDRTANISITKLGGKALWMLSNRPVGVASLEVDQAKEAGRQFLDTKGFTDMVDTYYIKEDNTATINYAYKQGDYVIYPDLIKVKIALDNGEVLGFESKGYLANHTVRELPVPRITEAEARAKVNPRLDIRGVNLAIIPTDYKTELACYELKGKLDDQDFLIYINVETGKEEEVLLIIDTPNGILTI